MRSDSGYLKGTDSGFESETLTAMDFLSGSETGSLIEIRFGFGFEIAIPIANRSGSSSGSDCWTESCSGCWIENRKSFGCCSVNQTASWIESCSESSSGSDCWIVILTEKGFYSGCWIESSKSFGYCSVNQTENWIESRSVTVKSFGFGFGFVSQNCFESSFDSGFRIARPIESYSLLSFGSGF